MKTAKIKIPKDHEIDTIDKLTGEVSFKKKPTDVLSIITTIAAVLAYLSEKDEDVIDYRKLCKVFDADHHLVNYQLCVLIVKALNEKRRPDWDSNDEKWALWFYMGGSSGFRFYDCDFWHSVSDVGSRLCFMERKLGEHVVKQPEFFNAFKKFMTYYKK